MITRIFATAAVLVALSAPAFAFQWPVDMKKIDQALAGASLSAKEKTEVTELRATGEQLHNGGKHYAAVAVLARAKEVLGVE